MRKRPLYCSKLIVFTYSCHCKNFVKIGELQWRHRKIDIFHSCDRFDQKPIANLSSLCAFLLPFLNGLSYGYRSKLVRCAFQKRFECRNIEVDSVHGFEMRRSTAAYFILITILGIATFFAKKLDLQPL